MQSPKPTAGQRVAPQQDGDLWGRLHAAANAVASSNIVAAETCRDSAIRIAALETALRPFADWIKHHDDLANGTRLSPDSYRIGRDGPTLGELRAALAALRPSEIGAADGRGGGDG